jgi:hypothetical protein
MLNRRIKISILVISSLIAALANLWKYFCAIEQ